MAKISKSFPALSFAAFIFFAPGAVSPAQEGSPGPPQGGTGDLIRLAASRGGENSLDLERQLGEALINNPPFSESAQESVAPAAPAPSPYQAKPSPAPAPALSPLGNAKPPTAASPPPPATRLVVPEMLVRGYGIDSSGAIVIAGMDGHFRMIDGSKPVKLKFPPEYRLPPVIVGGGMGPPPRADTELPSDFAEIAVREYSTNPSGGITVIGMDGYIETISGVNKIKLVFPPEYGIPPVIVAAGEAGTAAPADGGQAQGKDAQSGVESASKVLDGIGTILQNLPKVRR